MPLRAETALIAVASNFLPAAEVLARDYGKESGDSIVLSAGATGTLAARIGAGAPYDAFLSADAETPERLIAKGDAVAQTRRIYATGQLALVRAEGFGATGGALPAIRAARHIALANPALAPYGKAAVECLEFLGVYQEVAERIVMAENVGQAATLVASGAAEIGIVARSAIPQGAPALTLPGECHAPITQVAVLLSHGQANGAARGFLAYLASDGAKATIVAFGYGVTP
ncbi:MAG: molybdate ABC transporter substrate-binding protein [Rhodobacteraceae bacterium]|nr:molybdate ABC transporter substrate-binding protein [Paracoccaceae bacterium]